MWVEPVVNGNGSDSEAGKRGAKRNEKCTEGNFLCRIGILKGMRERVEEEEILVFCPLDTQNRRQKAVVVLVV